MRFSSNFNLRSKNARNGYGRWLRLSLPAQGDDPAIEASAIAFVHTLGQSDAERSENGVFESEV
jgi:hypothetical protein